MKVAGLSFLFLSLVQTVFAQYTRYSPKYNETMDAATLELRAQIETDPDVELIIHPDRALLYTGNYVFQNPDTEDYRIGILMDPCRGNSYDCCVNTFGTPEYPALINSGLEAERIVVKTVIADEDEISVNYNLVLEDSVLISDSFRRKADDEAYLDDECISLGKPHTYCLGKRYAKRRFELSPACVDNNSSLNTMNGCYDIYGNYSSYCTQVAYTQNAFIGLCGSEYKDSDHCGTYLEIHMHEGSPYHAQRDIISEVKLDTRNVSGYYTTTLSTHWMGDPKRVLCAYTEDFVRIGSTVYIEKNAPVCCCPQAYKSFTRTGSFMCPVGAGGGGPYAGFMKSTAHLIQRDIDLGAYPYCRSGLLEPDVYMCAVYDAANGRHYTRKCHPVTNITEREYSSPDLVGEDYVGVCPYFDNCALTRTGQCHQDDFRFTFIGRVGRVVGYDDTPITPVVSVTFNDGRTSYDIEEDTLKLERTKSMYEVWWVQRTRSERVVEKRKGFNVTEPTCTFDTVNDRYFPWAELDENGKPMD